MQQPFFSIVIPTRDRSDFMDVNLKCLTTQTFKDFEVIISDNYVKKSCKEEYEKYNDSRFRYYHPEKPLEMNDNWEYALGFVTGKYVLYLEDKMCLYKNSLEIIYKIINEFNEPDIINWHWDYFSLLDEDDNLSGILQKTNKELVVIEKDKKKCIEENLSLTGNSFQDSVGTPGSGCVMNGVIKKSLLNKIVQKYGRVFEYYAPDYGPRITLLWHSNKILWLTKNLTILLPSHTSTGEAGKNYQYGVNFIMNNGGTNIMEYANFPDLYIQTNIITAESNFSVSRIPELREYKTNSGRLLAIIKYELMQMIYAEDRIKEEQTNLLNEAIEKLSGDNLITFKQACKEIEESKRLITKQKKSLKAMVSKALPLSLKNILRRIIKGSRVESIYFADPKGLSELEA